MRFTAMWIACAVVLTFFGASEAAPPNFVVVLTDDQDVFLGSADDMPKTKSLIQDQGMTFSNGFVTTAVCCPSRSSILTGRYIHNHGARNNTLEGDCSSSAWQQGPELQALPTFLPEYNTLYAGKYLNQYGNPKVGGPQHVPPGWTDWYGLVGNSKYYDYVVSDNGVPVKHGSDYEKDYFTDRLKERAVEFVDKQSAEKPFLLFVATPSAHAPFTPAPQYSGAFDLKKSPRVPSWNQTGDFKHQLLRMQIPMTGGVAAESDEVYRRRLETLLSVDDLVESVFNAVDQAGLMNNTYFFFTADHGFHFGEFGMAFDKRQLYENDIRVPFFVRGPDIPTGTSTEEISLVLDLAPTIVDLATGRVPDLMDGRSLAPVFHTTKKNTPAVTWRSRFLVEYFGEGGDAEWCGSGVPGVNATLCDQWNNTYRCLREMNASKTNDIFCQFTCYDAGHNEVPCPKEFAEGIGEYYDMVEDPFQLKNAIRSLPSEVYAEKLALLNKLAKCAGQEECNSGT